MTKDSQLGTTALLYQRAERMGLQPDWVIKDGLFAVVGLFTVAIVADGHKLHSPALIEEG